MEIFVQKETIMKKTYTTPKMETIEVRTIGMLADSRNLNKGTTTITSESSVLGRDTSTDWDDDWND